MKKQFFFIILVVIGLVVVGCKTLQPTITNTTNTITHHDSIAEKFIYIHDTIYQDRYHSVTTQNDTVYIKDSIYIYIGYDRIIKDTVYITNTDTIITIRVKTEYVEVEKPIYVEVEKPIAPFVRNSCITLWCIIGVALLALIAWVVWKFATGKISWASIISKLIRK